MRILQICNSLGMGGAEKLLLDTVPLYRKAGIEMDVLVVVDNNYPFAQELEKQKCCKFYILNKNVSDKKVYDPFIIFKLRKILKNYDIAHLHMFPTQYYAVLANILNGNKTKLIHTEHNTSNTRISTKYLKPVEKYFYSKYQKVICITDDVKNIYKKYLRLGDKLITINNGVDIDKIQKTKTYNRTDFGYSSNDILLIMVARFAEQKDQDTLIKSLKYLPDYYKLILVGDGWRKSVLKNLVQELNLSRRINFLGIRSDVYSIYKMSDLAILSSHWEGFGIAAVEAMACGTPIIASNVDGLSTVVEGAGLLFVPGDAENLSEKIRSLEKKPDCYARVVKTGIERSKEYDINLMVEKHIHLYENVMKK